MSDFILYNIDAVTGLKVKPLVIKLVADLQ